MQGALFRSNFAVPAAGAFFWGWRSRLYSSMKLGWEIFPAMFWLSEKIKGLKQQTCRRTLLSHRQVCTKNSNTS